MNFKVPIKKPAEYAMGVFNLLSTNLQELAMEYGKWPDQIVFSGVLGKEVYDLIIEKGWDLMKFGPQYNGGAVNSITFKYSKRIDKVENHGMMPSSIENSVVNSIITPEKMEAILRSKVQLMYTLERRMEPKITVHLSRN